MTSEGGARWRALYGAHPRGRMATMSKPDQHRDEAWRPIEGWPYSVSDRGRVRNDRTGYLLKPSGDGQGYRRVHLHCNGERYSERVHRLVLVAFVGAPPEGQECNHKNGDKSDNRLENLEWATRSENNLHARDLGLMNQVAGERVHAAKLTASDVREIRRRYEGEETQYDLADEFGVDRRAIGRIVNYEQWCHVGPEPAERATPGGGDP